jgi:selenocysteine-specific elongation factor
MAIIGTAGHVDHGKSTLVRALTGIDPDRLAEEKRRGLTIDLGFAHLDLPSGERVGIVDVPGHARFLHNMLAGVHGMDLVLLVVAADEGVMPQTREHLDIAGLLGVRRMVVAITKVDLVEPHWLQLVAADVRGELGRRGIEAEMVEVAAPRGLGLEELTVALSRGLAGVEPGDSGRPRLPVDRAFTIVGFGTVVTGTLVEGPLSVGQEVELLPPLRGTGGHQESPRPLRARVRGLQQYGRQVEEARPGSRVAVNLQGIDLGQLHRGQVLAPPGGLSTTTRVDVRLRVLPNTPQLQHNQRLRMHTGTAQVAARLVLLDGDDWAAGAEAWAQLRLAGPVAMREGDRLVLRRFSPSQTIGGGTVVDLTPALHRRRQPGLLVSLEHRLTGRGRLLEELRRAPQGATAAALRKRLDGGPEIDADLDGLIASGDAVAVGQTRFAADSWRHVEAGAREAVSNYLARHPLRTGMPRERLRQPLGFEGRALAQAVEAMLARQALEPHGPDLVALPGWEPKLSAAQRKVVAAVIARLSDQPLSPPRVPELAALGLDEGLLEYLENSGSVIRVAPDLLMLPSAVADARASLQRHLEEHGSMTVAAARDVLGSSRRTVVPLLEYFDATHVTRRDGDLRFAGRRAPQGAGL